MVWSGAHIQPKGLERITQKQNLFLSLFLESTKSACFGDLAIIIHQDCSLQIFFICQMFVFRAKADSNQLGFISVQQMGNNRTWTD